VAPEVRRLVFALLVAAMVIAVLVSAGGHQDAAGSSASMHPVSRREVTPPRSPDARGLRHDARRFVAVFLLLEAGRAHPATRARVRRGSVRCLARKLLALPKGAGERGRPGTPSIATLDLVRLPDRRDLALVSGTARRPAGPEPFAFLFARRSGRWLAVAPAE
jgi:hypothetical protein